MRNAVMPNEQPTTAGRTAAAATLVSATLAASHCLAPIAFAIFGTTVGAVAAFSVLARYQPYFLAAGFACWGYGFYRLYSRNAGPRNTPVTPATSDRSLGRARTLLWVGFGGLLVAIALPRVAALLAG